MKWRVVMEVTGADGAVGVHEIGGGARIDEYSPRSVGLTLAEGKLVLAGLQHHLVQAQTDDHCRRRRRCQRCGTPRRIKDKRSRRLVSLFGTVNVSAPRFEHCRCAVTRPQTLSPVSEIMAARCTPESSGLSRRWVLRCRTGVPGRCCRSFCRSTTFLRWRRPANARSAWAPGWKRKPSHWRRWQNQPWWKRNRSRSPLMAAMSDRLVNIRGVRSRSCSPRSQTTTGSRSSLAACRRRLCPNGTSCAAFFISWARRPPPGPRFSAMGQKGRARSAKRPVPAQPVMCWTGSTFRCGSSILIRRPKLPGRLRGRSPDGYGSR
jgi:hypothetical protein